MTSSGSAALVVGTLSICCLALLHCSALFDVGTLDSALGRDAAAAGDESSQRDAPNTGPADAVISSEGADAVAKDGMGGRVDGRSSGNTPPSDASDSGIVDSASNNSLANDSTGGSWDDSPSLTDAADAPSRLDGEAGAAHSVCVTSFGDGGSRVLFNFDSSDGVTGWFMSVNGGGPAATIAWTLQDGHACPGALTMTVPFKAYNGIAPDAEFTYATSVSWNGAKKVHVWAKVQVLGNGGSSEYLGLSGLQLFVQSNNWANYSSVWVNVSPTFGDGAWHEIVMDILAPDGGRPGGSGPDVATASVQRIGMAIVPPTARPVGAPATPPTAALLLDDMWLE